ncbi:MAG: heavy metal translocating P-type ATPase, partial [Sphaerochaetaceae bacterium]|nr:heavy metal translocating P-type ATPase [Sphaerochaetaceae bacterium]
MSSSCNCNEHSNNCNCHSHQHNHNHSHDHNQEENPQVALAKIIVGSAFFISGIISSKTLNSNIITMVLFAISYVIVGYEVGYNAIKGLFQGELFDENFLMFIASVGAIALGDFGEAVAVMVFYNIGEFCQDIASDKARDNIEKLMDIAPQKARK